MNNILFIKDDEVTTNLFKHFLEEEGDCTVYLARSGPDAIRIAKKVTPSVIVTDMFLRGKTGVAILDELKSDPLFASIPAIILTAEKEATAIIEELQGNSDVHMPKPINLERLKFQINQLIAAAEA